MSKPNVIYLVTLVFVAGAACLVYGRAVDAPFVFDDPISVNKNVSIRQLWPLVGDAEHPGPLNPAKEITTSGRPLVNLTLAVNYHFGQLHPAGYHVFNLIVHILSAWLLMAIVRRTLRLDYFEGRFDRANEGLAFAVALLWAVHPLQTETVVYVTQRTELLVGFFYLATLYASLRYWWADSAATRNTWLVVATLACFAGMASKEVMVTAPVVVLLFERTFVSESFWRALRKSWPLYIGLFLSWGLLYCLNRNAPRSESAGFNLGISPFDWWLTQTRVLMMYLKLAVWPWPLAIHYQMPYLTTLGEAWPWVLATALVVIGTLILLWRLSAIGFLGAWVLIILSPTLVVPIATEMAAERRMYLPLAALVALLVVGGYRLLQRTVQSPTARGDRSKPKPQWPDVITGSLAGLLAVLLSAVSIQRLAAYQDDLTLWGDTVTNQPSDYLAHNNYGKALSESGHLQEAIAQYQESIRLNVNYYEAHNNLGAALNEAGQSPEAIPEFEQALRLKPKAPEAHNNLGLALANTNRPREAIAEYEEALRLERDYPDAHFNLSLALRSMGRYQDAVAQCLETLRLTPDAFKAWANLALVYGDLNQPAEAIAAAEKAIEFARARGQAAFAQQLSDWLKSYRAEANARGAAPSSSLSPAP